MLGSRDTRGRARQRQLSARGARPLQEDDDSPAAPLLRPAERAHRCRSIDAAIDEWMARMELPGLRRPPDRNAVERHVAESPVRRRGRLEAGAADPRRAVLRARPGQCQVLKDAVLEMRRRGTTVVFSTHDMATAERMCDRIFMIFRGRKVLDGTLESIQDAVRRRHRARADRRAVRRRSTACRTSRPSTTSASSRKCGSPAIRRGSSRGSPRAPPVYHFEVTRPSLQDIFVRIAKPAEVAQRMQNKTLIVAAIRVRHARPQQGVPRRRAADAGGDGAVDHARAERRRTRPTTRIAPSRSSTTRGVHRASR